MPNRKFTSRFPPARIKKIMRTDKEVGKVAASVPVVLSRSLELFAEALIAQAGQVTLARGSRKLSPAHLRQCIMSVRRFDFLRELVADVAAVDDEAENSCAAPTVDRDARDCNGAASAAVAIDASTSTPAGCSVAAMSSGNNGAEVDATRPGFYQSTLDDVDASCSPSPPSLTVHYVPRPEAQDSHMTPPPCRQ